MARFYCPMPLLQGQVVDLPSTAARHVQVLRMQPGHPLTLFNGEGGEFQAEVQHMGRSEVRVVVGAFVKRGLVPDGARGRDGQRRRPVRCERSNRRIPWQLHRRQVRHQHRR